MSRHPDARTIEGLAARLRTDAKVLIATADDVGIAHLHIADMLEHIGWPQRSSDTEIVSGSNRGDAVRYTDDDGEEQTDYIEFTAVERAGEQSYALTSIREDMRDQVAATLRAYTEFCGHIKALMVVTHTASRTGLSKADREALKADAVHPSVCSDNQVGKHAVDEWGDGICILPGVKGGLCQRHYYAWYRARQRDGIDTTRDHEEAA